MSSKIGKLLLNENLISQQQSRGIAVISTAELGRVSPAEGRFSCQGKCREWRWPTQCATVGLPGSPRQTGADAGWARSSSAGSRRRCAPDAGILADSGRSAAGIGDHPPARHRADAVRQAAVRISGRPVHHRRRGRRRARASRTRQVHHQSNAIDCGPSMFGRRPDTATQGRRYRAPSAAHRAPTARRAGLRDESDVSILDRHTQPLIRLPVSSEMLALRLMPGVRGGQLETLFSEPVAAEPV